MLAPGEAQAQGDTQLVPWGWAGAQVLSSSCLPCLPAPTLRTSSLKLQ